jgi:hypothetical protein
MTANEIGGDCGDRDCDACHFARTQGVPHCSKKCVNAGAKVGPSDRVKLDDPRFTDRRLDGAIVIKAEDVSRIPVQQYRRARLVVRLGTGNDDGFGFIVKDSYGVFPGCVRAPAHVKSGLVGPALVAPAQPLTVTVDLGDALAVGLQMQMQIMRGLIPAIAAEPTKRIAGQLVAAARAAANEAGRVDGERALQAATAKLLDRQKDES